MHKEASCPHVPGRHILIANYLNNKPMNIYRHIVTLMLHSYTCKYYIANENKFQ